MRGAEDVRDRDKLPNIAPILVSTPRDLAGVLKRLIEGL